MAMSTYGQLTDLTVERRGCKQITGNIYKGKVTNTLEGIQGAFINLGERENGFIHTTDLAYNAQKFQEMFDMDFSGMDSSENVSSSTIKQDLKEGDEVLVQVVKEPIGTKGARLTSNVSIPGRLLVLLPTARLRGVSRKIDDRATRDRLKKLIKTFELPQEMGIICRTASRGISDPNVFINEAHELVETWKEIREKYENSKNAPELLYEESDLIKRALTTALDKKFDRLIIDDYKAYKKCLKYYKRHTLSANEPEIKIELYKDKDHKGVSLFEHFDVERQIEKAMRQKVWFDDGYLIFEQTEAMHTIDVNSGRSKVEKKNLDATLAHVNIKAAEEIARQIRIRNMGGLIICDFIDMQNRSNKRKVLEALKNAMKEDSAKYTILGMSDFGLVEMTRQRNRESLHQTIMSACPYCHGSGNIKKGESILIEIERALKKVIATRENEEIEIVTHPELAMKKGDKMLFDQMASKSKCKVQYKTSDILHLNDFHLFSLTSKEMINV